MFTVDDFVPDSDDEDLLNTKRWIGVEDHLQTDDTRLLDLEGHLGQPPEDMPFSLLWVGAQAVDEPSNPLLLVKGEAMAAEAVARTANDDVAHQTCMAGLNNACNLTARRVGDLETRVTYLQTMLQESGDMMMRIADGSISVVGHQNSRLGTVGLVTRAHFKGYKAAQKHLLTILAQKIEGDW